MNEHPSPEFEKEIRETLRAPGADPAFVRTLRVTLLERSHMKKPTRPFYRLAWGLAAAILLLGLLAVSPGVVQALKQLLGYLPGLGYMEQGNSLRMLAAPVTQEKDGLQLTVLKGAADSEHTILLAAFEGDASSCVSAPRLVLSDGTVLEETQHETGSLLGGSYYQRYVFAALPIGQLAATLEVSCTMSQPASPGFALPLDFQAAPAGQVMPPIELPAGSGVEGFSVVVEKAAPLPDGTLLSGRYEWTDPRFEAFSVHVGNVEISDANGQPVAFQPADPGFMDPAGKKLPFAYQITGKDHDYPLTIKVTSMVVDLHTGTTFEFDAGPEPQVGQVWDADIAVPVAEHVLHIQAIELVAGDTPAQLGFTFRMTSDPAVVGARIQDTDPALTDSAAGGGGGGGGGGRPAAGSLESGWLIEGYSPAGPKTFVVSNITIGFEGSWQATWQPAGQ